ncbi:MULTISPECIES: hypothetical protein [unclassified Phaeobacter]|uniref:hypothetical protein n=1 Tax=unclassified Phaeobacter TaxID=2621772 RepID=UPI003A8899FE
MSIISIVFTGLALGLMSLLAVLSTRAGRPATIAVAAAPRRAAGRKMTGIAFAVVTGPLLLTLPGPADAGTESEAQVTVVNVLGRSWHVAPEVTDTGRNTGSATGRYMAQRQNAELQPFRPPAVLTARQAVRAFHAATGCRARVETMVRSINGTYFAQLACR